jgi:hypothetical protein
MGAEHVNRITNFNVTVTQGLHAGNTRVYFYVSDDANLLTQSHRVRFMIEKAFDQWHSYYDDTSRNEVNNLSIADMQFDFDNKRGLITVTNNYTSYIGNFTAVVRPDGYNFTD